MKNQKDDACTIKHDSDVRERIEGRYPRDWCAWLDHITRVQVTFEYTQAGPVGLLTGKKVFVIKTHGG